MLREFKKDSAEFGPMLGKGTWQAKKTALKTWVNISCPTCGASGGLTHDVAADGTVFPSVACPFDCPFHEYIRLVGWNLGAINFKGQSV